MAKHNYKNIMEILVEQEVAHQMRKVPPQMVQYVRAVEVMTYALNRLPVLYACSEKGMQLQLKNAKQKYGPQIVQQVHWAIAAVQRDPLRQFKPIQQQDQKTLNSLRDLLKDPGLTWDNLPHTVSNLLALAVEEQMNTKQGIVVTDEPTLSQKKDVWSKNSRKIKPSVDDFGWDQDVFIR
ncbi:MAG: late competence development ComFB family protein [Prochlorothrix sp.]|nr:late competence development ComFB family protein [Prochlorothrix sp.]